MQVPTFDVQTQAGGPLWTLHQWCLYWEARRAAASRELPPSAAANGGAAAAEAAGGSTQQGGGGPLLARRPTEDEADSAAVKRKRSAEEEAAQQQLKGISAESRRRLLEVAALPLTGTALDVRCGWLGWTVLLCEREEGCRQAAAVWGWGLVGLFRALSCTSVV